MISCGIPQFSRDMADLEDILSGEGCGLSRQQYDSIIIIWSSTSNINSSKAQDGAEHFFTDRPADRQIVLTAVARALIHASINQSLS